MTESLTEPLTAFNTHRPILEHYIKNTSGDIIEVGMGDGSTGFILDLIKGTNRKLVSLENNEGWYDKMLTIYPPSKNHIYEFYTEYERDLQNIFDKYPQQFSIAFIDSSPWMSRVNAMNYYRNTKKCNYIMVHDVDYFPKSKIFGKVTNMYLDKEPDLDFSDVSENFRLFYPPKPYPAPTGPPTLIFSPNGTELL